MNWRALRGLESTHVLRVILVLAFLGLYEAPFLSRIALGDQYLRFPIWDLRLVDHPWTFPVLEGVYIVASLVACTRRFAIAGCLVAGLASLTLVTLDRSDRLQFAYLPGGALLAFALSEVLKRTRDLAHRADLPLALLLGSIYAFASFHKLWNFRAMQTALPASVFDASRGALGLFCDSPDDLVFTLTTWAVVPYEAMLSFLTLTRRWWKLRLVCVCLFHWTLVVLAPHIWHVSLFMLSLQFTLAWMQRPEARSAILSHRKWVPFGVAWLMILALRSVAGSIGGPAGLLGTHLAFATFVLLPIFFLAWPCARVDSAVVKWSVVRLDGIGGVSIAVFASLLLAFGLSPILMQQRYSVRSVGWTMFAGGEHAVGVVHSLRTPAAPCFTYSNIAGVLWSEQRGRERAFNSYHRVDLERLKRYFEERRRCGGPPLRIESRRF